MQSKSALVIVDIQNDFCAGGRLAVPEAERIIPLANDLQAHFDFIVATLDWHPKDHKSFASQHPNGKVGAEVMLRGLPQILWPDHCVQFTKGAEFHPQLNTKKVAKVFYKGIDPSIDSYSAFFDNAHLRATGLGDFLYEKQVKHVYLLGLATDYCVKYSALDAVKLGFNTYVIHEACRGVNLSEKDSEQAFKEMQAAGVALVSVEEIVKRYQN